MITESSLSLGATLGAGNFGDIIAVHGVVRPDLPRSLVYKRFRGLPDPGAVAHLAQLVEFRNRLTAADRDQLDRFAAWPVSLVADASQRTCGLLMPCAPGEFMYSDAIRGRSACAVGLLYQKAQRSRRAGAVVPGDGNALARLVICARLAHALAWLHARSVVFGDISQANELFTIDGEARIYLIDLDSVAIPGSRVEQPHTPGYRPPELGQLGPFSTPSADVFKFTCVLVRILSKPREQLTQRAEAAFLSGVLDAVGVRLVERGLSDDPRQRPSMAEFYRYLYDFIGSKLQPPQIESVNVDANYVVSGTLVAVTATAASAPRMTIHAPDGSLVVSGTGPALSGTFIADGSGRCRVTAKSDAGAAVEFSPMVNVLPAVVAPPLRLRPPGELVEAREYPPVTLGAGAVVATRVNPRPWSADAVQAPANLLSGLAWQSNSWNSRRDLVSGRQHWLPGAMVAPGNRERQISEPLNRRVLRS